MKGPTTCCIAACVFCEFSAVVKSASSKGKEGARKSPPPNPHHPTIRGCSLVPQPMPPPPHTPTDHQSHHPSVRPYLRARVALEVLQRHPLQPPHACCLSKLGERRACSFLPCVGCRRLTAACLPPSICPSGRDGRTDGMRCRLFVCGGVCGDGQSLLGGLEASGGLPLARLDQSIIPGPGRGQEPSQTRPPPLCCPLRLLDCP